MRFSYDCEFAVLEPEHRDVFPALLGLRGAAFDKVGGFHLTAMLGALQSYHLGHDAYVRSCGRQLELLKETDGKHEFTVAAGRARKRSALGKRGRCITPGNLCSVL
jgi:hypothetical protein